MAALTALVTGSFVVLASSWPNEIPLKFPLKAELFDSSLALPSIDRLYAIAPVFTFITFKSNLFQKNYSQRIKDNIKTIKKLPKIKGIKEIMYPGQNKFNRYRNNLKKKISISEIIKKDLKTLIS